MRPCGSSAPTAPSIQASIFAWSAAIFVESAVTQLVGSRVTADTISPIWAPRQTGKTWIMRRAVAEIRARYGDRFTVGVMTVQAALGKDETDEVFLRVTPGLFVEAFSVEPPEPADWDGWRRLFARQGGVFDRPVILLIDEVDSLPPAVLHRLVGTFRKMYLSRESHHLHGLALVGVRAVLGVESTSGSPFNVQRSLHVPNLTQQEVAELFAQYATESGQPVLPEVVGKVFETTRGQPGLVSWFGELLTVKYNPDFGHSPSGSMDRTKSTPRPGRSSPTTPS